MLRLLLLALVCFSVSALTIGTPARVVSRGAAATMAAAKIRTGDMVKVLAGDGKGTVAKVIMLDPKKMTVTVEGVNMQTKHMKPMKEGEQGRIIKRERPMHLSNVAATGETAAQDAAPAEAVAKE